MAEVVSQRITNELTRLYAAVNEVANRAVVTSDDIQYFINCLEHFHRHLLRLSESGFVTAHSVSYTRHDLRTGFQRKLSCKPLTGLTRLTN